jgi:hypothetical protein
VSLPITHSAAHDLAAISTSNIGAERRSVSHNYERIELPAPLCLWHLASLDAPTVALVWCLAFAWVAYVSLPFWTPALIMLAVWAVYVCDRLLDASRGRHADIQKLRERHFFHWRHRRVLLPLAVAAAAIAAFIIFTFMPVSARERDSLLVAASFAYFSRVHSGRKASPVLSKEFLVGFLFTVGCALPAWSRAALTHGTMLWSLLIPAAAFAALAWLNCYAIDRWESSAESSSQRAITHRAEILAITCGLLSAALCASHPRPSALLACATISALLLGELDRLRNRLTPVALRAAADLVLLTPLLLVPFAAMFHQ